MEQLPMAHNLEERDGRYSFAFTGERGAIWHQLGQQVAADASRTEWLTASGFDYHVEQVPAIAALNGEMFDHISPDKRFAESDYLFTVRQDTGHVLGIGSKSRHEVQPSDIWEWFADYITVDDRFHIDAAGVLSSGERLWMTARFNGDLDVAGDKHVPRLLMSTSYDGSQATRNEATMTRVVCQNTLRAAHLSAKALVKTRHNTRFDGKLVARELAQIAGSFAEYKQMGDAMAQVEMTRRDVQGFFAKLLDIPADAKEDDISPRMRNIAQELVTAYNVTKAERNTNRDDVWSALQGVTRYVDHNRTVRNAANAEIGRFDSGTFGSGDQMKGKALGLLLPLIDFGRDKVLIPAMN
jgi:phage/plasmid-like protein (TIGR03299 family)